MRKRISEVAENLATEDAEIISSKMRKGNVLADESQQVLRMRKFKNHTCDYKSIHSL